MVNDFSGRIILMFVIFGPLDVISIVCKCPLSILLSCSSLFKRKTYFMFLIKMTFSIKSIITIKNSGCTVIMGFRPSLLGKSLVYFSEASCLADDVVNGRCAIKNISSDANAR